MKFVCPKCSYQRTPTDTAPDWQCPSCGIAYNKFIPKQNEIPRASDNDANIPLLQGSLGDSPNESSFRKKILSAIAFIAAFGVVRYALTNLHAPTSVTPTNKPSAEALEKRPVKVPEVPRSPRIAEANIPVESLRELFEVAHEQGEANGLMVIPSGGKSLSPNFNPVIPVNVKVSREYALPQANCDRFKVMLTQGGSTEERPNGRLIRTAITMRFGYSINHCIDSKLPEDARQIVLDQ